MKIYIVLLSISILNFSCKPDSFQPYQPGPFPNDSIPADTIIDPAYDYDLLWALPIVSDTGACYNNRLPIMYRGNLLWSHLRLV